MITAVHRRRCVGRRCARAEPDSPELRSKEQGVSGPAGAGSLLPVHPHAALRRNQGLALGKRGKCCCSPTDVVELQQIDYSDIDPVGGFLRQIHTDWLQVPRQNVSIVNGNHHGVDVTRKWAGTT